MKREELLQVLAAVLREDGWARLISCVHETLQAHCENIKPTISPLEQKMWASRVQSIYELTC
jgi:hypothetical protein